MTASTPFLTSSSDDSLGDDALDDDRGEPVDAVDRARGLVDAEAGDGAEGAARAVGQVERRRREVLERLAVVRAEREAHLDLAVVGAELLQRVAAHRDGDASARRPAATARGATRARGRRSPAPRARRPWRSSAAASRPFDVREPLHDRARQRDQLLGGLAGQAHAERCRSRSGPRRSGSSACR